MHSVAVATMMMKRWSIERVEMAALSQWKGSVAVWMPAGEQTIRDEDDTMKRRMTCFLVYVLKRPTLVEKAGS
jgi:hypothetical protein